MPSSGVLHSSLGAQGTDLPTLLSHPLFTPPGLLAYPRPLPPHRNPRGLSAEGQAGELLSIRVQLGFVSAEKPILSLPTNNGVGKEAFPSRSPRAIPLVTGEAPEERDAKHSDVHSGIPKCVQEQVLSNSPQPRGPPWWKPILLPC